MSYSVFIVPREVEAKYKALRLREFFETEDNLIPFEGATLERILNELELRGFVTKKMEEHQRVLLHESWGATAIVTKCALYLSASGDGVFEIGMLGSEFADEDLAKFDPQDGSWE